MPQEWELEKAKREVRDLEQSVQHSLQQIANLEKKTSDALIFYYIIFSVLFAIPAMCAWGLVGILIGPLVALLPYWIFYNASRGQGEYGSNMGNLKKRLSDEQERLEQKRRYLEAHQR